MEFAIGQNVWVMTAWDPTIKWEEGVITQVTKRFVGGKTYDITLSDGTTLRDFKPSETGYSQVSFPTIKPYFFNLNQIGVK